MDRNTTSRQNGRTSDRMTSPKFGLIITTALASVALAGCTTSSAAPASASFAKAQSALDRGKVSEAITHAEAAVLAEPRNSGFRAMLGASYLEAGRFEAAATAFNDALELGDGDPRTVLSYALAATASGDRQGAMKALQARSGDINPADLGLAMALAGNPQNGVHVLTNALRSGQNTAKLRQNLAYTYALSGNWRAARVMAAEDVPADQLDARLSDWAANARPEDVRKRVAALLGVSASNGGAQPAQLSLANFPSQKQRVAEAAMLADAAPASAPAPMPVPDVSAAKFAQAPAKATQSEALAFGIDRSVAAPMETMDPTVASILAATGSGAVTKVATVAAPAPAASPLRASSPTRVKPTKTVVVTENASAPAAAPARVSAPTPVKAVASVAAPAAAPAPVPVFTAGQKFVANAVIQDVTDDMRKTDKAPIRVAARVPQRRMAASAAKPAPRAVAKKPTGSHLVQLGSFSSRADANAGWVSLKRKFPQLKPHDVVITKAKVKGKTFYRVAAAGFSKRAAANMCGSVKSSGRGCFAYAASNPPKGAVDRGVRIAAR